jgi:hypothetical protein
MPHRLFNGRTGGPHYSRRPGAPSRPKALQPTGLPGAPQPPDRRARVANWPRRPPLTSPFPRVEFSTCNDRLARRRQLVVPRPPADCRCLRPHVSPLRAQGPRANWRADRGRLCAPSESDYSQGRSSQLAAVSLGQNAGRWPRSPMPPSERPVRPGPPMGRCITNKSSQGRADTQ